MKLVKTDYRPVLLRKTNDARLALEVFVDEHIPCAEVTEYNYKSARCLAHRLYMEINKSGFKNIKAVLRRDKVYLVNTLIKED